MTETSEAVRHPARYSNELVPVLTGVLRSERDNIQRQLTTDTSYSPLVLDPFAGTGRIHEIADLAGWSSVGVEIEPEWAEMHTSTVLGSALDLPWEGGHFDAVVTSPTYGNRFADSHNARDGSLRRSYTHDLGRQLHEDNSGAMQWGPRYRDFHRDAWKESVRVLRTGGILVLNISDHIRKGERQAVTGFHIRALCHLGLDVEDIDMVSTRRMRYGANSDARPIGEYVITFRKGWHL